MSYNEITLVLVVSELEVASEYEEWDRVDGSQGGLKRVNGERVYHTQAGRAASGR
jgi:hypothetical protein